MKSKNKIQKAFSVSMAILTTFSIAACNQAQQNPYGDKELLWVGNYDGGAGHKWLDELIKDFEAVNPNVKVLTENKKDEFGTQKLTSDMPYSNNDIYFLDHTDYRELMSSNLLEDITDVVTEKVYDNDGNLVGAGGTKSIIDRVYPETEAIYNVGTEAEAKYFALPFFYHISGIIYDADLFNDYNLYFDNEGKIGVKKTDANVGPGPDGKIETSYDNGEPETWGQFLQLLTRIKARGNLTPFTWSGQYVYPRQYFSRAVQASYNGKANELLNYTLEGTDSKLGEITTETGYKLMDQEGKLASVIAAVDIMSDSANYTSNSFNILTQSHTVAQTEFVYSVESEGNRVAMLLESSYWETEATRAFADMEEISEDYAYGKRNFRYMSIPRFVDVEGLTDQENYKTTLWGSGATRSAFINKNSDQKELAKDFLQFVYSRIGLVKYSAYSNTLMPLDYEIKADEYSMFTPYMKSIMERIIDVENVDVVIEDFYNPFKLNNDSYFSYCNTSTVIGDTSYIELMLARKESGASVAQILAGMKAKINERNWPTN